ncbi:universal stress protein [Pollutibacter soli]|uniref:universal stress protein n=1 Tax=Pollutibacter soli TaxID=3034157 RepID=UPI003013A869
MKTIIATTEFSQLSIDTVNYAADMARAIGARLILIHTYAIPIPVNEVPVAIYDIEQLTNEAGQRMEKLKERLLRRTDETIIIQTEILPGDIVSVLSEYAEKIKPFAIVMGAEGMGAVQRFLFGGKTVAALKRIHWPLIIVPRDAHFKKFKKIGLACDFEHVEDAVHVSDVISLVQEFEAELHVLYIVRDHLHKGVVSEADVLQNMLGEVNPKFHFITEPDLVKGITTFAEYNDLDLLIVVPKWHDILDQIFHTRKSKKLVLHSRIPVLSIHE